MSKFSSVLALAAGMLFLLLLASLHMISAAVQRSEEVGPWFMPLLLFTVVGLVLLFGLVGWNLWQLLRDYRQRVAGSRLSTRLSMLFLLLALVHWISHLPSSARPSAVIDMGHSPCP